jgi:hypothetical protein
VTLKQLVKDPRSKKENESMKFEYQIVIAGIHKRDMEYKEKAIDYILEQTGGWKNEMMLEKDMHDYALTCT